MPGSPPPRATRLRPASGPRRLEHHERAAAPGTADRAPGQHTEHMEARLAALQPLYASFTPEQKKLFDAQGRAARHGGQHGRHHGMRHGMHHQGE
ncbi:Spy/CpxP family protein refolding chaperone [Massilia sp. B-10]|nr:Spy/CpxP family protein refolding chaperone [Massilia sp. B-10]